MDRGNPDSVNQPVVGNQGQREQGTGPNFGGPTTNSASAPDRSAGTILQTSETTPAVPPVPNVEPKVETPTQINQEFDPDKTPEVTAPAADNNQPVTLTPPPPASITKETQIIQPHAHINQDYHTKAIQSGNATTPELLANQLSKTPTSKDAFQTVSALSKLKASNSNRLP